MDDNKCDFTHCSEQADTERRVYHGDYTLNVNVCKPHAQALDFGHPIAINFYGVITAS